MTRSLVINRIAEHRGAARWLLVTAAALIVLALLAGYWVLHCADGAMTPEFCAKALSSIVLVVLAGPLLSGWLAPGVMPIFASAQRCRFYRPPKVSRA